MTIAKRMPELLVVMLLASSSLVFGQDSSKIVILSPRVGPEIDRAERDRFRLFSQIRGFERAEILVGADNTYYARVLTRDQEGSMRDTIISYSEMYVFMLAEKINHLEDLENGTYRMGTDPPKLQTVGGFRVTQKVELRANQQPIPQRRFPDKLGLATELIDESLMEDYPTMGFGLGVSSYSPDYSGLKSAYIEIEDKYRNQGIYVPRREPSFGSSAFFLWLNFKVKFSNTFAFLCEAGTKLSGESKSEAASVSVLYTIRGITPDGFHPYVGVGIGHYRISAEQHIGASLGNDVTLDALLIDAANVGYNLTAGVEAGTRGMWSIYGSYLYVPAVTKGTTSGVAAKVDLSSVVFGARVSLFF